MKLKLPEARLSSTCSIEESLLKRRSVREFADDSLSLEEISQLLWAAYGITSPEGYRTAPSAMTAYPLEVYVVCEEVDGLDPGLYHYQAEDHSLQPIAAGRFGQTLYECTFDQQAVEGAPAILVFSAVYERTCSKLGEAGRDHVHMDLGHAGQNVHLQAVGLGLGTVVIGAFRPDQVKEILGLPASEQPLYLMPVGRT